MRHFHMKHDGTAALLSYWNRIRGKRPAPERNEIEPGEIARQLPDVFILEQIQEKCEAIFRPDLRKNKESKQLETKKTRFRLAGTRLCAIHGGELKSTSFLSLWGQEDRTGVEQILQMVFENKRAAMIDVEGKSISGRRASFEMALLPLADAKLIGSMIALDPAYWLGADRITENSVRAISMVDPRRIEMQASLKAAAGWATAPAYFHQPQHFLTPPTRQIRHLTVVKGGKD
jgi:hypothetical protein